MRPPVDAARLRAFMRALGQEPGCAGRVYLTGGGSAVLLGWRALTADVDVELVPDSDAMLRAIERLKPLIPINVELASPAHFLPELPGWQERSRFIVREGQVDFFHYDFHAQALSKILRGQEKDLRDVQAMVERGLVDRARAWELLDSVAERLFRYPSIEPAAFRRAVEEALGPKGAA